MSEKGYKFCSVLGYGLVLLMLAGALASSSYDSDKFHACDFSLRWNECQCAHMGINPFKIWNREVAVPGFKALSRPDMIDVAGQPEDLIVHAYPAWHMLFFWWYGWFSKLFCMCVMSALFGAGLMLLWGECKKEIKTCDLVGSVALCFIGVVMMRRCVLCFGSLNYGLLIVAGSVLLFRMIEKNRWGMAGVVWAFMMIKPQLGLLFFWPILFARKYLTILVAMVICLLSAGIMAGYYGESLFDLIMQIPQIGMPYGAGPIVDRLWIPLVGDLARYVWPGVCFAICGVACYLLRHSPMWCVRCAPVAVLIPIWTYCMRSDFVMDLIWYFVVMIMAFRRGGRAVWRGYALILVGAEIFIVIWSFISYHGLFDRSGMGWVYYLVVYGMPILSLAMIWQLILEERKMSINNTKRNRKENENENSSHYWCGAGRVDGGI